MRQQKPLLAYLLILCVFVLGYGSYSSYASSPISQSYTADKSLAIGTIVSLEKDATDQVAASMNDNIDRLFGVVVNTGTSPLEITQKSDNQVQVATSGVVETLVSDCNGTLSPGDHITVSPIKGVGMKATSNTKVIGIAQGTIAGTTKEKVDASVCSSQEVTIGQVPILVNIAYFYKQPEKTVIPAALQNIANTLAGRKVDPLPIIISGAIFLLMIITVSSIVYSMIRSSIISVGRNPLSQSAIYRDLVQLSILVLAIIGVSVTAIYLILTRL